jgi:hypothetical protein
VVISGSAVMVMRTGGQGMHAILPFLGPQSPFHRLGPYRCLMTDASASHARGVVEL